jgi:hypothetical protein
MSRGILMACAGALALAACSEAGDTPASEDAMEASDGSAESTDAASDSAAQPEAVDPELQSRAALPANMPKLAYEYGFSYRLPAQDISGLMRRHADACEQQGPTSCRVLGMELTGDRTREDLRGTLQLAVAAGQARALGALIEDEAEDAGAEQVAANITSDEVSKQIVDTEARIRAREQLRDRLMEVLRTRKGSVQELVEAERSVAAVNEEIDQARSWLAETRGRVAFSRVNIEYTSGAAPASDFMSPVEGALGSIGSILGALVAALIVLLVIALPLGAIAAVGIWLRRRLRLISAET